MAAAVAASVTSLSAMLEVWMGVHGRRRKGGNLRRVGLGRTRFEQWRRIQKVVRSACRLGVNICYEQRRDLPCEMSVRGESHGGGSPRTKSRRSLLTLREDSLCSSSLLLQLISVDPFDFDFESERLRFTFHLIFYVSSYLLGSFQSSFTVPFRRWSLFRFRFSCLPALDEIWQY
jgi:hypothetical protein